MKFFVAALLTALLAFLGGLYLPWWSLVIAAFIAGWLVHQSAIRTYFAAFIGLFFLWAGLAWWLDAVNDSILSARIAKLLPGPDSPLFVIILTGLVAGLLGGMGALTGHFLRARKAG